MKPFSNAFNAAVVTMANRLFPTGFDVSETLDVTSLDGLRAAIKANGGRMVVWAGASEDTIYADAEVNYAYRAWHDWCHLTRGFQFTLHGEQAAARLQMDHVRSLYGNGPDQRYWQWLLHCEAVEQTKYFLKNGDFVQDQRDFTTAKLAEAGDLRSLTTGFLAMSGFGAWEGAAWTIGGRIDAHGFFSQPLDPFTAPPPAPIVPAALDQVPPDAIRRRLEVQMYSV